MNAFAQSNIAAAIQELRRARAALDKARDPSRTYGGELAEVAVCLSMAAADLENALTLEEMTEEER